jgi:hypothetical protein
MTIREGLLIIVAGLDYCEFRPQTGRGLIGVRKRREIDAAVFMRLYCVWNVTNATDSNPPQIPFL